MYPNCYLHWMFIGVLWCDSCGWTNRAKDIRDKCPSWGYIFLKTLTLSTWAQPVPLTPPCWTRRWEWGTRLMNLIHNYDFPSPLFFNASIKRNECTKKTSYRIYSCLEDDSDESFPHFLVVEATDSTPIKHSIFTIQKIFQCAVRNAKSAKKLRYGAVLVEVTSRSERCLWRPGLIQKSVSPHRSLNSSRGVIRCRDFRDCGDHEVMDALRSQGVIDVKHIQTKKK